MDADERDLQIQLVEQLRQLNQNLEDLRGETIPAMREAGRCFKDVNENLKYLQPVGRQIKMLNQILLQAGKAAGISGMIGNLLHGLTKMVKESG
jgi:hypothetical protein